MKNKLFHVLLVLCLTPFVSCSQKNSNPKTEQPTANKKNSATVAEPHRYGGWYCPDNLKGFPPVDVANWKNVPVIQGRMPTKEETQTGASLIFVDLEKYPDAHALDIPLPQLASFYNPSTRREEYIIVIQAISVTNDSIVGFRYLNGGNGSARINEVNFLSEDEIERIPKAKFVSQTISINAPQEKIWRVLTEKRYANNFKLYFDADNELPTNWRENTNVNFNYRNARDPKARFGERMYGNFYIQNDYEYMNYTEKFFLTDNTETGKTELHIVCGPFAADFDEQSNILFAWGEKVKLLSEIR